MSASTSPHRVFCGYVIWGAHRRLWRFPIVFFCLPASLLMLAYARQITSGLGENISGLFRHA
jgi:hypothetical protein